MQPGKRTILIHVFGCLAFLSVPVVFSPDFGEMQHLIHIMFFWRDFLLTVLLLVFFYVNYYYLTPAFYITKKYFIFFGLVLVAYLISVSLPELLIVHRPPHEGMRGDFGPHPPRHHRIRFFFLFNHNFLQFLIVLIFSMLLKIRERLKQTETEKANAELSYLKAQINHTFYSTP